MAPTSPLPPSTSTASPHSRPPDIHQSAATFNPAAWINHHLTPTSANPTPSLSSLLDNTDNLLQESHATLDSSLKSALTKIPWALRETERVRQRATSLRSRVDGVGARVDGVETGIVSSVRTIADADTVVRRVQQAATLLSHAASAEKLLDRLDSLLARAGGDGSHLVAAADVVADVRAALKPLQHIPELKDRFEHLQKADARLEQLAAPSLLSALQERNAQAARNARIVFDHAGRENAFREQYVQLRGAQIVQLWSRAWNTHSSIASTAVAVDKELNPQSMSTSSILNSNNKPGDLASPQAHHVLKQFYKLVVELISTEATWLADAFPDLRDGLLPALMYESMDRLTDPALSAEVSVPSRTSNPISTIDSIAESLFTSGTASVEASAEIVQLLLPDDKDAAPTQNGHSNGSEMNPDLTEDDTVRESNSIADVSAPERNGTGSEVQPSTASDAKIAVLTSITDALTALLIPFRKFWETLQQTAVQQARIRADAIPLATVASVKATSASTPGPKQTVCPSFGDLANDVETLSKQSISLLDTSLAALNRRTCGIGIEAMKQMISAASSTLSDRLLSALRLPVLSSQKGEENDEWTRVSGGLRLLISASSLKRSWDSKKESSFAVAIGTATPILEIASVITQDGPEAALRQFLNLVSIGNITEAGIVWELVRDRNLASKTVSHFESLDSTTDFQAVVDAVHRLVYNAMFQGISDRFKSFQSRDFWSTESVDGESAILGFSSSPLGYATEVADYLMTIPQQLEPFVPDEEDTTHATPKSQYIFSKAGVKSKQEESQRTGGSDEDEGKEEDDSNLSFAGMWIAVLSIGTMELYVEKICEVPRISEAGARQLGTDTDYICNVIASLGVAPTSEMSLICRLLESKQDSTSFTEAASGIESSEHRKIARQIAAARGISVTL